MSDDHIPITQYEQFKQKQEALVHTAVETKMEDLESIKCRHEHEEEAFDADCKEEEIAIQEYEYMLEKVNSWKEMTSTKAWKELYSYIAKVRRDHDRFWKSEDNPKKILQRQQQTIFIDELIVFVEDNVNELSDFCRYYPLFAQNFHTRAKFNRDTGQVDITVKK